MAARIGDGFVTTSPDKDAIDRFRRGGDKQVQAGAKVCFAPTEEEAVRTAHRLWPNDHLPGELAQVLPTPEHFQQASELVTEDVVREAGLPLGPDVNEHVASVEEYAKAGVDELFVQQIGGGHHAFFDAYGKYVLPRFG
jgi:G6PDH family F420-dependent oxidoreductase